MYLIYIQLHPSNCNSSIPMFSICQIYVPIHPMHSIHDQLHFINSMLSIYPKYAPIHPMHSIHRSTALHPFNALHLPKMCPPVIQCTPFTISWNLVDFKKERERGKCCEENVVWAMSIVPFSFWVGFSPVFGGFKNKNVKKVGFLGSLFKMLDSSK